MTRYPWHCPARYDILLAVLFTGLTATTARSEKPDDALLRAARGMYSGLRTVTLANGLRVVLQPIQGSPVVTTMMAYRVGSADEDLDHTGLAHYLEHLMFKGTAKLKPGDIDRLTQRNGGANNASTSEDCTFYFFDFAADRWEAALAIEADRMRNLRIDARHEFEQEKGAVIEELQRDEDEPWDLEQKKILPFLFGKDAPYGHPVIGQEKQVRAATARTIKAFYDRWYHPNNAVLVVCGGFDPDRALASIKELFDPIPKAALPPRKKAPRPQRKGPVRVEFSSKFDVPRLLLGFYGVRSGRGDYYALEVIDELLAGGKTSRLYRKLVEQEKIANELSSTNNAGRYPGWLSIQVEFLQGKDPARGERLVLEELKHLQTEPVAEAELNRVRRRMLAQAIFKRESVHGLAEDIARGLMINDLDFLRDYLTKVYAVTARDVQQAAHRYLDAASRVVVVSIPRKEAGRRRPGSKKRNDSSFRETKKQRSPRASLHPEAGLSLKNMKRVVLDNGLTLLLLENHRLPIVAARAWVRDVDFFEPANQAGIAALTGMMLDEGTDRHTGPQIARLIEDVGGTLSLNSSGGEVKVLAPDRALGLGLLLECLSRANFPQKEFALQQERLLSTIEDDARKPAARARRVYRALVYGKHPYGRPDLGTRKTVAPLTAAACLAFYQRVFVPNNTVLAIVGDFDRPQVVAEVKRLTAGWGKKPLARPKLPSIVPIKHFTQKILTMPRAAQLHFYMGHVGVRRTNPDYYKLLILDNVLGSGQGFTDRLSARLRDRQGLAYEVGASITATAGEEPGLFTCEIGTRPANFALVKKVFLEELKRIRTEVPSRREVEDAKKYLLGSLPFDFTTDAKVADLLLRIERYQLGTNYLEDYRKAVAAVMPEEVRAVAAKYLDPEHMVLVAAGALRPDGRPLEQLPTARGRRKE
jgi:zinc protease